MVQIAIIVGYLLHCAIFDKPVVSWTGLLILAFILILTAWGRSLDRSLERQCEPKQSPGTQRYD